MSKLRLGREFIKADLRTRFGSLSAFELAAGLPRGAVTDLLRGRASRPTVARIAQELGVSVDHLIKGLRESRKSDNPSCNSGAAHRRIAA